MDTGDVGPSFRKRGREGGRVRKSESQSLGAWLHRGSCSGFGRATHFLWANQSFLERFFFGTRTDHRKRTIAPKRNDMTTLEPKPGLRPIPTIHVLEAQNSPTAGLGSPTQAAQTDSHRIPP